MTIKMTRGAAKLREMIKTGRTIVSPGVYEGLGARVCLQNGFDTLYMVSKSDRLELTADRRRYCDRPARYA